MLGPGRCPKSYPKFKKQKAYSGTLGVFVKSCGLGLLYVLTFPGSGHTETPERTNHIRVTTGGSRHPAPVLGSSHCGGRAVPHVGHRCPGNAQRPCRAPGPHGKFPRELTVRGGWLACAHAPQAGKARAGDNSAGGLPVCCPCSSFCHSAAAQPGDSVTFSKGTAGAGGGGSFSAPKAASSVSGSQACSRSGVLIWGGG